METAMGLPDEPDYEVAIIGAGLGGICAAIKLLEIGIEDFVIIDRDEDFGGTWLRNTYPGVGADIPVVAYQFTFAPKGTGSGSSPVDLRYSSTPWIWWPNTGCVRMLGSGHVFSVRYSTKTTTVGGCTPQRARSSRRGS